MNEGRVVKGRVVGVAEERYRLLLIAYPADWRRRHGDALLGVLLDRAEAEQRSAPTLREVVDLMIRGLAVRVSDVMSAPLRRRVASISTGLGAGFALVYVALFIAPDSWGNRYSVPQSGPTLVLVAWLLLVAVVLLRLPVLWRALTLAGVVVAAVLPFGQGVDVEQGRFFVVSAWVRPDNGNAAFLVGLAVLAAGPIDRTLMLRTAVIAVVVFALGFVLVAGWRDPYDQTLWAAVDHGPGATPGTLQTLWGGGAGACRRHRISRRSTSCSGTGRKARCFGSIWSRSERSPPRSWPAVP